MIKLLTHSADGRMTFWIGLSTANLERLPTEPIVFDLPADLPEGAHVAVITGPTEKTIVQRLKALGLPIPDHLEREPMPGESITFPADGVR